MTTIEMQRVLAEVRYKDWYFAVKGEDPRAYLQLLWSGDNGFNCSSRKWPLSSHMCKSEIVQTAFLAVMTAEEHETRESFTYKQEAIFGPHFHVDKLVKLCKQEEHIETRAFVDTGGPEQGGEFKRGMPGHPDNEMGM